MKMRLRLNMKKTKLEIKCITSSFRIDIEVVNIFCLLGSAINNKEKKPSGNMP